MCKCRFLLTITLLFGIAGAHAQQPDLPNFAVNSASITFSNAAPVEGEEDYNLRSC